jgi:hypothetical protein
MMMMNNTCESCKYFFIENVSCYKKILTITKEGNLGFKLEYNNEKLWCRKYPQKIEVTEDHYCGEFVENEFKK